MRVILAKNTLQQPWVGLELRPLSRVQQTTHFKAKAPLTFERCTGLMVSVLDSGLRDPGLTTGDKNYIVLLGKTLHLAIP